MRLNTYLLAAFPTLLLSSSLVAQILPAKVNIRLLPSPAENRRMEVTVTSQSDQSILMPPKNGFYILNVNFPYTDGIFEATQKTSGNKDSVVAIINKCGLLVPNEGKRTMDTLHRGKTASYNYQFACYTENFIPGHSYRVRLCFKLSNYNKLPDVYSNWIDINP